MGLHGWASRASTKPFLVSARFGVRSKKARTSSAHSLEQNDPTEPTMAGMPWKVPSLSTSCCQCALVKAHAASRLAGRRSMVPSRSPVSWGRTAGEIADLQAKKSSQESERAQATKQADDLDEQIRREKGQKGLDLGLQAATARKKARDAHLQVELTDMALDRAQKDGSRGEFESI